MDRKRLGKRRNCSLRAISPFPSVSKRLVSQGRQKGVIVWEWVQNFSLVQIKSLSRQEFPCCSKGAVFSSPEHEVLMVSYCDSAVSVVLCVSSVVHRQLFTLRTL